MEEADNNEGSEVDDEVHRLTEFSDDWKDCDFLKFVDDLERMSYGKNEYPSLIIMYIHQ